MLRPILLLALASVALVFPKTVHAQGTTNSTAPTTDPRCSQHRSRDACDVAQPFNATVRCQWRFGACVRAAYCAPSDCSNPTANANCEQCSAFGNWCRSKPIGCPTACDRLTVQTDCNLWASTNNGVPSCRWDTRTGRCGMVNPWAAARVQQPSSSAQDTRAPTVPGGGNDANGPSVGGPSTTNNSNNVAASPSGSSEGTKERKNAQYVIDNPKLVPGILGGAAVVAVAGMVYIMRPTRGAPQANSSPIAVQPKPFRPSGAPQAGNASGSAPPAKKPVGLRNHINTARSPRLGAAPATSGAPNGLLSPPSNGNKSLHPGGIRRGVVRKPSSLRMGVSADGTETESARPPASPRSAPSSPHISPLASPSLTPNVVTTKTADGKLTVSLAPPAQSVSPQSSPRLSPLLTPTAVATRTPDGKLTVSLASPTTTSPASPTFSPLPSPTLSSASFQNAANNGSSKPGMIIPKPVSVPMPPAEGRPAIPISTPPPAATSPTGSPAPSRSHSIRSHVSLSPSADRSSFTPEMLATAPAAFPHAPAVQQPARLQVYHFAVDDAEATSHAHLHQQQQQQKHPGHMVRQASQSSLNAGGAPVRGTSAMAAKPNHF